MITSAYTVGGLGASLMAGGAVDKWGKRGTAVKAAAVLALVSRTIRKFFTHTTREMTKTLFRELALLLRSNSNRAPSPSVSGPVSGSSSLGAFSSELVRYFPSPSPSLPLPFGTGRGFQKEADRANAQLAESRRSWFPCTWLVLLHRRLLEA